LGVDAEVGVDSVIGVAGVIAILLLGGTALGLADRQRFSARWLLVAAVLVIMNDALLTGIYGKLPHLLPSSDWNWQGKALALAATLAIAALPAFGWRRCGLTLTQAQGALRSSAPIILVYVLFFVALAFAFPERGAPSKETIAFQLTMPGLEEEAFYRGVLLFALGEAFTARIRILGAEWGWGALLSCGLFGLAHAFGFSHSQFSFDPLIMTLTSLPSLIAVWLRLRTGSVVAPIILHNFGNSASLLLRAPG
jgi:membrane protease YdiL (CAAX protease family)